ncbi:hypothetical protein ABH926_003310 [Catenulispora sp. GP43]|uniref:condensation domain-containing protein n=1 Tax=Catenulispora sp. GP43 TaxID=3156263 RepID=UPI0035173292
MAAVAGPAGDLPASVGQRLLWVLERFRGEQGAANVPIVLRLRGPLDHGLLAEGLSALTARHESLRTTVSGRGRRLAQHVHPAPEAAPMPVVDLTTTVEHAVLAEIGEPIDVQKWPTRTTLWRLDDQDHVLCFNMHHAATDGWSCGLVLRDLSLLTDAGRPPLPELGWQYSDFCAWQDDWLRGERAKAAHEYWERQLTGAESPGVPLRPTPAGTPRVDGSVSADISAQTVAALQRVARARRTTLPTVMLALYYAVLHRATGEDDLAVASFMANRGDARAQETVGLLANMLVLRTRLGRESGFDDLVRRAHDTVMAAYVHQGLPYQLLPAAAFQEADRRADDVMFQMIPQQDVPRTVAGAAAEAVVVDNLGTRFEAEFQLYQRFGAIRAVFFFNAARLERRWAADLLADYVALAARAAAGRDVLSGN